MSKRVEKNAADSINEEEEADKPLEEGTGGMGNTNNAIEVEK